MCSALYRGGKSVSNNCHSHEGGKSGQNASRLWFVRAVFGGVSFKFHWRLSVLQSCPRPLLLRPLCATFVHILRLTCLLSTAKLQVVILRQGAIEKALEIVAN